MTISLFVSEIPPNPMGQYVAIGVCDTSLASIEPTTQVSLKGSPLKKFGNPNYNTELQYS